MHWPGNGTWREGAAHPDPGNRSTVPPHLRRRSRGCQTACCYATEENKFSPVHSVIAFQRLKPPGLQSCGQLEEIKDNDCVTNAPPLQRLQQSVKRPSAYHSLWRWCVSSRCQLHHKRKSQHHVNGRCALRSRLHHLACRTTNDRMAASREIRTLESGDSSCPLILLRTSNWPFL